MRDIQYRRTQRERMRRHAYEVIRHCWRLDQDIAIDMSKYLGDNLAICSCYGCRNMRHNDWASNEDRLTIQERRFFQEDFEAP